MRKHPSVIRCGRPLASLLTLAVAFWAGVAMASVPVPVVSGPIPANAAPGGPPKVRMPSAINSTERRRFWRRSGSVANTNIPIAVQTMSAVRPNSPHGFHTSTRRLYPIIATLSQPGERPFFSRPTPSHRTD